MTLTLEEVEHIANLARLALNQEDKIRYRDQLSDILDYFAQLEAVDTTGIPPTSSVLPTQTPLRKDEPQPCLDPNELFRNAPDTETDQFRVPPVFEE
jgi:aspartyl-tRNA(Asn)/glutamyl-tRNA(Gln) amidotransferase subunit C